MVLGLDGIDTGINLDGFTPNPITTFTSSGAPENASQILAALKADNDLEGTIIDRSPPNIGLLDFTTTTLEITCRRSQLPRPGEPAPQQNNNPQEPQQNNNPQDPQGASTPITQEGEQEGESGEIDQSFDVS